jgi:hypothetical protein
MLRAIVYQFGRSTTYGAETLYRSSTDRCLPAVFLSGRRDASIAIKRHVAFFLAAFSFIHYQRRRYGNWNWQRVSSYVVLSAWEDLNQARASICFFSHGRMRNCVAHQVYDGSGDMTRGVVYDVIGINSNTGRSELNSQRCADCDPLRIAIARSFNMITGIANMHYGL